MLIGVVRLPYQVKVCFFLALTLRQVQGKYLVFSSSDTAYRECDIALK